MRRSDPHVAWAKERTRLSNYEDAASNARHIRLTELIADTPSTTHRGCLIQLQLAAEMEDAHEQLPEEISGRALMQATATLKTICRRRSKVQRCLCEEEKTNPIGHGGGGKIFSQA